MVSPADFDKMVKEYQATLTPAQQPPAQQTTPTEVKTDATPTETKKPDLPNFGDNPFVADLNTVATPPAQATTFEKVDDIFPFITKETGVEVKDANDINTFVSKYKETQNTLNSLQTEYQKAKQVENIFTQMPDDLFTIVTAWANNQDYRAEMHRNINQTIDYSKPFDQQDAKKLLLIYDSENFTPDKFSTDEDYQDFKESNEGKTILKLVKDRFNSEQKTFVDNRTRFMQKSDELKSALTNSASASVNELKTSIPYFKEEQINDVTKTLNGGQAEILSLFFNPDGTYKKDAAEKVSMIKYAKQAIDTQKTFIKKHLEEQTIKELITRGADQPPTKQTSNTGADTLQADAAARGYVEMISGQPVKGKPKQVQQPVKTN